MPLDKHDPILYIDIMKANKHKQISDKTRKSRIQTFIDSNKYLNDFKYYKNNYLIVAHGESIVCQKYTCRFCWNLPAYCIHNKRITHTFCKEIHHGYFCDECLKVLEDIIDYKFKREYCS